MFHESFDKRIALGMGFLLAGVAMLSWSGTPTIDNLLGPLLIVGACLAWGLDNNLTRRVSLADPLQIVEIKGLIAGPISLLLGLWAGGSLPSISGVALSAGVGFVGYGVSLRAVCLRAPLFGRGPYRCVFFDRAVFRRCRCRARA